MSVYGALVNFPTGNWVTVPGDFTGQARSRQILVVMVEGLRADTASRLPIWEQAAREGATGKLYAENPTYAWPNYTAMMTGTPVSISGILTDRHPGPATVDSLMLRLQKAGQGAAVAGSYAWPVLFAGQFARAQPLPHEEGADDQVTESALEFLSEGHSLVLCELRDLDAAGHASRLGTPYAEQALKLQERLDKMMVGLDLAQVTVVICSPHGLSQAGGQGGLEAEVREVPVMFLGAGIKPGSQVYGLVRDLAPTLAVLLGLPYPADSIATPLTEGLSVTESEAQRLAALADEQRRSMATSMLLSEGRDAYAELDGREALRQREKLIGRKLFWRWPLAFGLLALPVMLILRFDRRQGSRTLTQAAAWGVAVMVVFHGSIWLVMGGYSPSNIADYGQLRKLALFSTLLGFFLTTLFAFLRGLRPEPGRAAGSGVQVFIGTALLMETHILVYATIYGFPPNLSVPHPGATMMVFCVLCGMVGMAVGAPIGPALARQASRWHE